MRSKQALTRPVEILKPLALAAATLIGLANSGCGSSNPFPTATVSGTIKTQDGTSIANGRITFAPIAANEKGLAGKPARGAIEDGKFVLSTYGKGDGAVVGMHNVVLGEAWRPDEEYIDETTDLPEKHGCKISPDFAQVEVVAGDNVFEFIAVPKSQ